MNVSKISVVIPAYNRADLIGETLQSILGQSVSPFEIIVVDDGSTDGTADEVARFAPGVKLLRQQNRGAGAARNLGFQHSQGDTIHFMDSDDIASPNTYEVQLAALNDTGADFAYGPWVKTRFDRKSVNFQQVVIQQRAIPPRLPMYKWMLRGWVTVFQPCLLRRKLIEKIGPYRSDLKPTEDSEFLFRIGKSKATLVHTPDTLLLYRVHPESQISATNSPAQKNDWLNYLNVIDRHLNQDRQLDLQTELTFNFRKIDAIRIHKTVPCETAKQLSARIPTPAFQLEAMTRPFRRVLAKTRRMRFGDNYVSALGVGPMTEPQRKLVAQMGYDTIARKTAFAN